MRACMPASKQTASRGLELTNTHRFAYLMASVYKLHLYFKSVSSGYIVRHIYNGKRTFKETSHSGGLARATSRLFVYLAQRLPALLRAHRRLHSFPFPKLHFLVTTSVQLLKSLTELSIIHELIKGKDIFGPFVPSMFE